MIKVGINGFGRIGRIAFRIGVLKHSDEVNFAAINTSGSMDLLAGPFDQLRFNLQKI